jgi:hypothetical protein
MLSPYELNFEALSKLINVAQVPGRARLRPSGAKPIASIAIKRKSAEIEEGEAKKPKVDGDDEKA